MMLPRSHEIGMQARSDPEMKMRNTDGICRVKRRREGDTEQVYFHSNAVLIAIGSSELRCTSIKVPCYYLDARMCVCTFSSDTELTCMKRRTSASTRRAEIQVGTSCY